MYAYLLLNYTARPVTMSERNEEAISQKSKKGRPKKRKRSEQANTVYQQKYRHRQMCEHHIKLLNPYSKNRWKPSQAKRALLTAFYVQWKQLGPDAAVSTKVSEATANVTRADKRFIYNLYLEYAETKKVPDDRHRVRRQPGVFVHGTKQMTETQFEWLCSKIDSMLKNGEAPCIPHLLQMLRATFQVNIEGWTLRRALGERDYQYGQLYVTGKISEKDTTDLEQERKYVKKIDHFLKLEQQDQMVLVYMDESYCHTHHARKYGFFKVDFEEEREPDDF